MTEHPAGSEPSTPEAVAERLAAFTQVRAEHGWSSAVASVAEATSDWPAKRRQTLAVALAKEFKASFVHSGADTELERIQVARQLGALLADTGTLKRGAVRLSIELAQRARDHERILPLAEDLIARFPEQADYGHQALGGSLFALKRLEEARAQFAEVPEAQRTPGTRRMLERLQASTSVDTARALFDQGVALGDARKLRPADKALNEALITVHPELGKRRKGILGQTVAAMRGKAPKATDMPVPEIIPIFCGGFRWSGASAIYDFLAEQPEVAMFPRRPRFMQDSAGALDELVDAFAGSRETIMEALRAFVAQQVVGIAPAGAKPAGALRTLENSLLTQVDDSVDLGPFDARLATFVLAVTEQAAKPAGDRRFPATEFAATLATLSASLAPAGTRFVLFDSVIRAAGARLVECVPGSRLVAVFRDPRDMYVTHVERGRWERGIDRYVKELQALFADYDAAAADPEVADACRAVSFEALVRDAGVRRELLLWLGLGDRADTTPGGRFEPEQSAANVGIHRAFTDQDALRTLEAAFPDRCDPASSPSTAGSVPVRSEAAAIDVLTLSVMATRRQQLDRMALAGRPGEPGWKRRREIVVNLLATGGYDFIGLQHCATGIEPRYDAARYFREQLAERGADYGVLNRAAGEDPDNGDSTPLYYQADRWELDGGDHGFEWFSTPKPGEDAPGGGGLLFLYGRFHERAASGARSGRSVYVYNVRLRNRHTDELDVYRAKCFLEMDRHMARRRARSAPVVVLGDMNTKVPDSLSDRALRGLEIELDGEVHHPLAELRDTLLTVDPDLHGKVRSQHDFKRPGELKGTDRNDRVLASPELEVAAAEIMTYNEDGAYPSYHYPVRAELRLA